MVRRRRGEAAPAAGRSGTPARSRAPVAAAVAVAAFLAAALVPATAAAQGDPLDDAPGFGPDDGEMGWRGNADFGFTLTEGNSETTNLSVAGHVVWRHERSRWNGDVGFLRATDEGEQTASRGEAKVQYDYFPSERVFVFARGGASFNEPAGLDLRLSPAAGVGYQAMRREDLELTLRVGGSWIRDEFTDGSSDAAAHAVLAESFNYSLSETADLQQSLVYEPKVDATEDYLLNAEVSLSAMITSAVGLKVSFRDEFDSRPFDPATEEAREKNDISLVTGVTYRF